MIAPLPLNCVSSQQICWGFILPIFLMGSSCLCCRSLSLTTFHPWVPWEINNPSGNFSIAVQTPLCICLVLLQQLTAVLPWTCYLVWYGFQELVIHFGCVSVIIQMMIVGNYCLSSHKTKSLIFCCWVMFLSGPLNILVQHNLNPWKIMELCFRVPIKHRHIEVRIPKCYICAEILAFVFWILCLIRVRSSWKDWALQNLVHKGL